MQVDAPPLAHQATTPMLVSPSSSSAASAAAAADAAKGERLRALLFGAEHAERAGDLAGAQVSEKERERGKGVFSTILSFVSAFARSRSKNKKNSKTSSSLQSLWLQLLTFLQAEGALSVTTQAHGRALRERCGRRLHALAAERAAVAAAEQQQQQGATAAAAATGGEFVFFGGGEENNHRSSSSSSSSTAVADLAARLRISGSSSDAVRNMGLLFAAGKPPPRKFPRRGEKGGGGEGENGNGNAAERRAQRQHAAAAAAAAAAADSPSPRLPRQPLGPSSTNNNNSNNNEAANAAAPPPAPFARANALKRDSQGLVKGFYTAEGETGVAPPPPLSLPQQRAMLPPPAPQQQHHQQQDRQQQQQQQRWEAPPPPPAAAAAAAAPGFQSARSKLIAEVNKAGSSAAAVTGGFTAHVGRNGENDGFGSCEASDYSSGSMFPNGRGAFAASGLHPPGLLKNRANAAGVSAAGFVPPFIARAMGTPTGVGLRKNNPNQQQQTRAPQQQEAPPQQGGEAAGGPLSDRTRRLLGIDGFQPDGVTLLLLPDSLSRLDPHTVELVCNELLDDAPSVSWDDIAGQASAKRAVHELAVWPMLNPHLFTGARAPPAGLLLFGPPGTGKTLLGRAVAANVDASFFSISASSLTSKWIGEGEKLVRALFAVARALAPSVVFVDEIDSLLSARKADGEHESSRRMKTELLVQMEGCASSGNASSKDANGNELPPKRVLVIGATNRPEELDEAARRRMPKQLYVPLPCGEARRAMVLRAFGGAVDEGEEEAGGGDGDGGGSEKRRDPKAIKTRAGAGGVVHALTSSDVTRVVARTEGYSGSDMRSLIQEACQGPVRDALRGSLPGMRSGNNEGGSGNGGNGKQLGSLTAADLRPVVLRDFAAASRVARPSVEPGEVKRYEEYDVKHGARYCADGEVVAAGGGSGGGGGGGEGNGGAREAMEEW